MPPEPSDPRKTPAMLQYSRFKQRHPGCLLLFRIGDFYEMFDDDAVAASKAIGLTLTQRTAGIPMAGVPHHQLETYLKRLVAAGFRVAVGEQLIDATHARGIVPRAVTRVVTPGTLVDDALLESDATQTLAGVAFTGEGDDSPAVLAIVEVSTGAFTIVDAPTPGAIVDELSRRGVRELLYAETGDGKAPPRVQRVLSALSLSGTPRPPWHFRRDEAREALTEQFGVGTLAGFGLSDEDPGTSPAGAVVRYLSETQTLSEESRREAAAALKDGAGSVSLAATTLAHLRPPRREPAQAFVTIDAVSLRALEVVQTMRAGAGAGGMGNPAEGSLLGLFLGGAGRPSLCRTAMGKRLLREWLCRPLRSAPGIAARQDAVATLKDDRTLAGKLAEAMGHVQDIARIAARVALGRASPRDVLALARSLKQGEAITALIDNAPALAPLHAELAKALPGVAPVRDAVLAALVDEPPPHTREGGIFRDGIDSDLDEARLLQRDAGAFLADYQARLTSKYNLPGLKVGFNRVFGYYIELPQAQARQAPPELTRKQTLKNAERYTTPELAEFERKVMSAESRAFERERVMFLELCDRAVKVLPAIAGVGDALAQLDALAAFAEKAARKGWVRPEMVREPVLTIHAGRHPVLDEMLGSQFVPNDVELGAGADSRDKPRLALITGPNMAGKSTFIRQVALITLLAHTGCFVPADRATIGLADRIFTRIGADDALHAGQSTFMVEMIETANILNHASASSLVILDEIGRGTSTLDGLSLAWAIAEHLGAEHGPRTLFATHYHELTDLEERLPGRVANLHVSVREWPPGDPHAQIVFLHRILPGRTDQSYGVHVARLAGIPRPVIDRAREVLASLAVHHVGESAAPAEDSARRKGRLDTLAIPAPRDGQLSLFTEFVPHPAIDALREVKLDRLSPMQAFDHLRRIVDMIEKP